MLRTPSMAPGSRLLLAVTVAVQLGGCGGGGGEVTPPPPEVSVLDKLGVPTGTEAARPDAQTLHPLQRRFSVFDKRSELFMSGVVAWDATLFTGRYLNQRQVLLDDATSASATTPAYAPIFTADASLDGWTEHDSASVAADLNGDGFEEVVILYRNTTVNPARAFLRVIRRAATAGYEQSEEFALGEFAFTTGAPLGPFANLQLAAGDMDGDGGDELAAALGKTLLVLDWSGGGFTTLATVAHRPGETRPQVTTVAVGNLDLEPKAELVVVNGLYSSLDDANYYVYSLGPSGLTLRAGGDVNPIKEAEDASSFSTDYPQIAKNYGYARVAIGDLDGDNRNELIFAGDVFNNALSVTVARLDPVNRSLQRLTTSRFLMGWTEQWLPALAVLNADGFEGGRKKELLAFRYILQLNADGRLVHRWGSSNPFLPPLVHPTYWDKVAVGDFTGDGRDEVAYFYYYNNLLFIFGYADGGFRELKRINVAAEGHHTTLTAVNVDADSPIVKYTGEYELLWSAPQVVAVLAAPPFYTGQDAGLGSTSLTFGRELADAATNTVGFYAGLAIGSSVETPFWGSAGAAKLAFTIDTSLDFNFTTGSSESVRKTFGSPATEDQVVFASTPIDVYHYEVVVAPSGGPPGERLTIQLPRTPWLTSKEVGWYNSRVAAEYRVPAEVLGHRIGDPWSYPTRADMLALFADGSARVDPVVGAYSSVIPIPLEGGFRTPDPFMLNMAPGAGGWQGIELGRGASSGFGTDFNLQVGVEFENVASGVLVGGKAGFHYGYSHSFTTTDSTSISGQIPNIPASMADKAPYSVGLFAYPYPATGRGKYMVVKYWVE